MAGSGSGARWTRCDFPRLAVPYGDSARYEGLKMKPGSLPLWQRQFSVLGERFRGLLRWIGDARNNRARGLGLEFKGPEEAVVAFSFAFAKTHWYAEYMLCARNIGLTNA